MNIEEKLNAIIRYILAETQEEKEKIACELRAKASEKEERIGVKPAIENIFLEIGLPAHLKGYRFAEYAIEIAVKSPEILDCVTKELYPAVAKHCGVTTSQVERAIRHAIECVFDRCDRKAIDKYFGGTISPKKRKPTNSEFVSGIATFLLRTANIAG